MNQLQAFVYFLKRMDIVMLDEILTDDISYCGTTKALFLEKLQDIFVWNLFLENEVLPVQWSETNSNHLQFFCWQSNEYENILLVTSKESGEIISFINKRPHFGYHNSALRIYEDEEIGYVKSAEFIMLQHQSKTAIDEMTDVVYTTELILNWVNQYEILYHEIKDEDDVCKYSNTKYIEEFFWMWESKLYEKESILNYKKAELAVQEYFQLEVEDWLEKYYDFYCREQCPRNTTAQFICEKEYRFSEGKKQYQSKELYFTEKFFELYCNLYDEVYNSQT